MLSDNIKAIPIIPIEPAKAVKSVLPFLVFKLLKLKDKAVNNDIDAFPIFSCFGGAIFLISISYGLESLMICPSFTLTIRLAYSSANSGLWVTITTSLSLATSFNKSIT